MRWIAVATLALLGLPLGLVAAGQMGLMAGRAPADLGVREGRLKPPAPVPNSVSSQADLWPGAEMRDSARIPPFPLTGDGRATIAQLRAIVVAMPGATLVVDRPDYLYVTFRSRWLGFVDDAEFWFDPAAQVVHLRSAARLGRRDFGVNRARIEAIRAQLRPA